MLSNLEAYNKNEFLAVTSSIDDGKLRYVIFEEYNETREHGGINGLTPSATARGDVC